jgi:hypothetical protein
MEPSPWQSQRYRPPFYLFFMVFFSPFSSFDFSFSYPKLHTPSPSKKKTKTHNNNSLSEKPKASL